MPSIVTGSVAQTLMVLIFIGSHVAIPELALVEILHARVLHAPAGVLVTAVVQDNLLGVC